MPTRNLSEMIPAALRTLARDERKFEKKLAKLRVAVDEGDANGVADGGVFDRVRAKLQRPVPRR